MKAKTMTERRSVRLKKAADDLPGYWMLRQYAATYLPDGLDRDKLLQLLDACALASSDFDDVDSLVEIEEILR
jgi:hypothetical protein